MGGFLKQQSCRVLWISGNLCLYLLSNNGLARSQILPDGTLTNNTIVIPNGNTTLIEGGTQVGGNLFHSFQEFSISTGTEALFNNAPDIQNIISRVSGPNSSTIDGILSTNPNTTANLFLINPHGIVFGVNAQLNIGGSFMASTANSFKFSDGSEFSATNPQTPSLLAINVPLGLQFGSNPGSITTRAGLQVSPGQTLALLGGDVVLNSGNLTALQGRIELGSVASPGTASLTPTATGLVVGYESIENFGNIQLSGGAAVNGSGLGGGTIRVRGGQVALTQGSRLVADTFGNFNGGGIDIQASQFSLSDRSFVSSSTFGAGDAGNLTLRADVVEMSGTAPGQVAGQLLEGTFNPFNLSNGLFSLSLGSGAAGDITIDADRLLARGGISVLSTTLVQGAGGDMTLNISELAQLSDGSLFLTGTAGMGNAGQMTITANQLKLLNGTAVSTTGSATSNGHTGDLLVRAESIELRGTPAGIAVPGGFFTTALGAGNAGNLTLETGQLIVADGTQVSASSSGKGMGGNLTVTADSVELSGISEDRRFINGLFASSGLLTVTGQRGNASSGDLTINTRRLTVRDGAQISAATGSEGAAGHLTIRASESVEVSGVATSVPPAVEAVSFGIIGDGIVPSGIESNTSGAGSAGDLRIETGQLIVRDGAEIGVRGTAAGAAGNLEVQADFIMLDNQGALSAATIAGTGGNIELQASTILLNDNSRITTNTGNSDGGNITIATNALVAVENSDITANAQQGRGGQVRVTAQGIFGTEFRDRLTPESDITATSELGPQFNGIVTLNIQGINPSQGIVELPKNFADSSQQIATGCAADEGNSFVVTGRGGLPEDPTQALRGRTIWRDLRPLELRGGERTTATAEKSPITNPQPPIVEATGWVVNAKGQIELVAHAPEVTLQPARSNPAHCSVTSTNQS
ncbi:MAG TPA: filamentous hemagglutinin [Cyanobacteria bacterium UBA9273]|nr:filamentous hemagglutinin [Cyanobacteria bacterium UBA9273]